MPRQGRGRSSPGRPLGRPSAIPAKTNVSTQQTRSTTTNAPVVSKQQTPTKNQQQTPGLFSQMASTAVGVAVGSSIGHSIGGLFGGGSSVPATEQQASSTIGSAQNQSYESNNLGPRSCEVDAKNFTKCLDENEGNMQICGWYLEQLKACQATASIY